MYFGAPVLQKWGSLWELKMDAIGKVLEIIGRHHLLVESEENLKEKETLYVFSAQPVAEFEEKYSFKEIIFPKGEIAVVARQSEKHFLCGIYHEKKTKERVVPGSLAGLSGLHNLFGEKVIREQVKGEPSAKLGDPTVDLKFNLNIEPGDYVGRP